PEPFEHAPRLGGYFGADAVARQDRDQCHESPFRSRALLGGNRDHATALFSRSSSRARAGSSSARRSTSTSRARKCPVRSSAVSASLHSAAPPARRNGGRANSRDS